jgi:hypothetical protein
LIIVPAGAMSLEENSLVKIVKLPD